MKKIKKLFNILFLLFVVMILNGCQNSSNINYSYNEYELEREGIRLHLDKISKDENNIEKNILLVHGLTYSSHVFDVDVKDYSLVRFLAKENYNVWRLDIAGYGRSADIIDGFIPDSNYAAEDINAAVDKICKIENVDKIDIMGWSWGTVTTSRFVIKYPDHINKLILFAPILSGIGAQDVTSSSHYNSWNHASSDFQTNDKGIDYSIVESVVVDTFCSNCWRYDKDKSPNGGRRDICVDKSIKLIDLDKIDVDTFIICGDKDPYLNYDLINDSINHLNKNSKLEIINGASHVAHIEKPYYKLFQSKLINYLN